MSTSVAENDNRTHLLKKGNSFIETCWGPKTPLQTSYYMTERIKIDFTLPLGMQKQSGAQIKKNIFLTKIKFIQDPLTNTCKRKRKIKLTNHSCYTKRARAAS